MATQKDGNPRELEEARMKILQGLQVQDARIAKIRDQSRIDIERVERIKQELRVQYNAMAPISRLPAEVLATVFEIYVSGFKITLATSSSLSYGESTFSLRWFDVLHVCREWRHIALSTPRLWTCIWPIRSDYVHFALSHSGQIPLEIPHWKIRPPNRVALHAVYPPILRELSRVRLAHFRVHRKFCRLLSTLEASLDLEAPVLQELDIVMRRDVIRIPVLSNLSMPQLATLSLWGGSLPLLQTLIRPTLTILKFDVSFRSPVLPSALVNVLQEMPLLQRLVLSSLSADELPLSQTPNGPRPSWYRKIELPHLEHVFLQAGATGLEAAQLLDCLTFPAHTQITFSSCPPHPAMPVKEQYTHLLPLILSKIQVSDHPSSTARFRPRVMRIRNIIDLELWSAPRPEDIDDSVVPETVAFRRLELRIPTFDAKDALLTLPKLIDLSELFVLEINPELDRVDRRIWLRFFKDHAWPKLERLRLPYDWAGEVLTAFAEPIVHTPPESRLSGPGGSALSDHTSQSQSAVRFLVPTLKTLELYNYTSNHNKSVLESYRRMRIYELLNARAKGGQRIERLVLSEAKLPTSEEDIAALRNVCGTLEIRYTVAHVPISTANPAQDRDDNLDDDGQGNSQEGGEDDGEYWDDGQNWSEEDSDGE